MRNQILFILFALCAIAFGCQSSVSLPASYDQIQWRKCVRVEYEGTFHKFLPDFPLRYHAEKFINANQQEVKFVRLRGKDMLGKEVELALWSFEDGTATLRILHDGYATNFAVRPEGNTLVGDYTGEDVGGGTLLDPQTYQPVFEGLTGIRVTFARK